MDVVSCIAPLKFTTVDGAEREFRLTMRQQRDIANKFGPALVNMTLSAALPGILYECLVDKAAVTEEEFIDILPPDEELLTGFYKALREHFCGPKVEGNEKYRPPKTPPTD